MRMCTTQLIDHYTVNQKFYFYFLWLCFFLAWNKKKSLIKASSQSDSNLFCWLLSHLLLRVQAWLLICFCSLKITFIKFEVRVFFMKRKSFDLHFYLLDIGKIWVGKLLDINKWTKNWKSNSFLGLQFCHICNIGV